MTEATTNPLNALDWLEAVPLEIRGIAQRYGKAVFYLAMQTGAIGEATANLLSITAHPQTRQNHPAISGPINVIVREAGNMAAALLLAQKIPEATLLACRQDLDRFFALQNSLHPSSPPAAKSPGGIILQS